MAAGVPAGASTPNQVTASKPLNPDSASVGTSGSCAERWAEVMAMTLSLPLRTWPSSVGTDDMYRSICPPIRSVMAWAAPLYGMWRN